MKMMRWSALTLLALAASCSRGPDPVPTGDGDDSASLEFPFDGSASGKEDVFGRSLVGAPSPYAPNPTLLADPAAADQSLRTDMRQRREVAWQTVQKVLEPVPLLGLANQLEARPDCADGVSDRDLSTCSRETDAASCAAHASGDISGICAWDADAQSCAPTCDNLTLPDGEEIPTVPRFSTWYGVEDISRIFKYAYTGLTPEEQLRRVPFSDLLIGEAFQYDHSELDRSSRWPIHRYTDAVVELYDCALEQGAEETDDAFAQRCAAARQSNFSGSAAAGGGIARIVYSPASVLHMMRNYSEVLACSDDVLADTWCADGAPCADPPDNFSRCFRTEFPADAGNPWESLDAPEGSTVPGLPAAGGSVIIKATWARVGFDFELPAFDTDAEALRRITGPGAAALWDEDGDRTYESSADPQELSFPTPEDIYTIRTSSGSIYRLTALHIMTKELRHWQWITLWWSDKPDTDFGEDRPASFDALPGMWGNYKMCVVVDYTEGDADPAARFGDFPSLQAALEATGSTGGAPTWCSNPYIEHGAGNARTNCIGCHQHAGTRFAEPVDGTSPGAFDLEAVIADASSDVADTRFPANGRLRRRSHFATDYSWAFSRLDDLTELIRKDIEFLGAQDERWVRINTILTSDASAERGEEVFRAATPERTCTDCHGQNGEGDIGPNFEQVFAQKTEWEALYTIINGRGAMPAWGEVLDDQQLADVMAYLRTNFGPQ